MLRNFKFWAIGCAGLLVLLLCMLGGYFAYLWVDSAPSPDAAEENSTDFYAESEEDCLPDEVYDPVEGFCYLDVECEDDGSCALLLDGLLEELEALLGEFLEMPHDAQTEEITYGGEGYLVTYTVSGNRILNPVLLDAPAEMVAYQNDFEKHQQIWSYFVRLIPDEQREFLSGFAIFSDGPEEVLAAVDPEPTNPELWILSVDIVDAESRGELTSSLIHEFAHLLTLNAGQVPPDLALWGIPEGPEYDRAYEEAEQACRTYFTGEGCSTTRSYIYQFVEEFWEGFFDEWLEIQYIEVEDDYYAALDAFYLAHQNAFVSDYAATNPGEDIAESFTAFILQPKPTGRAMADDKVRFFYRYPEMVELREQIVTRLYSSLR